MTHDLIAAGNLLADTLEAENAALVALDLPRAAGLLADKQRAVSDLTAAQAMPEPSPAADRVARRLKALALENKRLLERAIAAQSRVIGVVGRAAAPAVAPTGYATLRSQRPAAYALSAKV